MTEEVAVVRRSGGAWKLALRLAVTVALLGVLWWKAPHIDLDETLPDEHVQTFALLFAALVATFVGVVLSAWRWQRVFQLFDVWVPLPTLTRHYLAGMFVGNVLPSTIGGDVLRVTRAANTVGSSTDAFGSVVLERLTGFVALPLLVFAGFALRPSLLDSPNAWIALLVAGITIAVLAIVLFVAGHLCIAGRFEQHENWTRFIGAVHRGVVRLQREPRQLVPVIGTAVLYQVSIVVMYGLIFRALEMPVPIFGLLAFAPAVLMLQVLPVSLAGLGVREGALVLFLHGFLAANGLPDSRAIAAGLLWYVCMLLVSVLGAPAFAVGHRHRAEPVESPHA